jgi:hypothetical protein
LAKIIAVMGDAGSGKTTFTNTGEMYGWKRQQMGVGLKQIEAIAYEAYHKGLLTIDMFDFLMLEGEKVDMIDTYLKEAGKTNETSSSTLIEDVLNKALDYYVQNGINYHNGIRRAALQYIGTEIMRKQYGEDVHINGIIKWLKTQEGDFIIESVRFVNEIEKLRDYADKFYPVVIERQDREPLGEKESQHRSETEWKQWSNKNEVITITNDGTIFNFNEKVNLFFKELS